MSVTSNIFTLLFVQAFLYPLIHPDDGTCQSQLDADSCNTYLSPFSGGDQLCLWTPTYTTSTTAGSGSTASGDCAYNPPGDSIVAVLFMALIAACVKAPLAIFVDWLLFSILAVPTRVVAAPVSVPSATETNEVNENQENQTSNGIKNFRKLVIASRFALSISKGAKASQEHQGQGQYHYRFKDTLGSSLNEDLNKFLGEIQQFRSDVLSKDFQRVEFDNMWGIDSGTGHFRMDEVDNSWWSRLKAKLFKNERNVHGQIVRELKSVRENADGEIRHMQMETMGDVERGQRLIRLFQQDLLPGLSSQILDSVGNRDSNNSPTPVAAWKKVGAGLLLVCIDAAMLLYVYLFAMTQSNENQDAWLKSFLVWLVVDTCVMATAMVYIQNMVIPSFAMKEVFQIREKLLDAIK